MCASVRSAIRLVSSFEYEGVFCVHNIKGAAAGGSLRGPIRKSWKILDYFPHGCIVHRRHGNGPVDHVGRRRLWELACSGHQHDCHHRDRNGDRRIRAEICRERLDLFIRWVCFRVLGPLHRGWKLVHRLPCAALFHHLAHERPLVGVCWRQSVRNGRWDLGLKPSCALPFLRRPRPSSIAGWMCQFGWP